MRGKSLLVLLAEEEVANSNSEDSLLRLRDQNLKSNESRGMALEQGRKEELGDTAQRVVGADTVELRLGMEQDEIQLAEIGYYLTGYVFQIAQSWLFWVVFDP